MPTKLAVLCSAFPAISLVLSFAFSKLAAAQFTQTPTVYDVVSPPTCSNNKGETVHFIETSRGWSEISAGMAIRDRDGKPVVYRSNYAASPPEFQSFVDRHECAHHQTGDVDRPHPPRNSSEVVLVIYQNTLLLKI